MKENQNMNYELQWICPISQELMNDPVIADDGFTYERKSIQNWFQKSNISPNTGLPLSTTKLIPNRVLKNTITQYFAKKYQTGKQHQIIIEKDKNSLQRYNEKKLIKNSVEEVDDKLQLHASSVFNKQEDCYLLNLEIIPPKILSSKERIPISMICILDTSESMNVDAVKDSKNNESHGFSRLDLVKHSIKTLIQFMVNQDELTLIIFNTSAKCILQKTKMTLAGKKLALQKINDLTGEGTTNIWEGLRISLDILKAMDYKDKNVFTILLTDGQPNLNPPRGIVPTLCKYIQIQNILTPNFHVFGYGYELDTKLLEQIARKGAGTFAYIPDCSMVGTVFINFMANCLSTMTNRLQLEIEFTEKNMQIEIFGFRQIKNIYNLGSVHYGQDRNILIKINVLNQNYLNQKLKFKLKYGFNYQQKNQYEISLYLESILEKKKQKNQWIKIRYNYLKLLKKCIQYRQKFQLSLIDIQIFYITLKNQFIQNQFTQSILKELTDDNNENFGQVKKAFFKKQWYEKWGKIYIPSLFLAHLMQVCTNFKDPALQLYGGQLFTKYQNLLDTLFIKMEPPKPSAKKEKNIVYKPAPVDMSSYYRNYGGCIDGQCQVLIWRKNNLNGQQVIMVKEKLKNIKKGDMIGENKTEIICMVQTKIFAFVDMVKIQKLTITPWHPIFYNKKWLFPIDIVPSQSIFVQSYFNFVTKNNQSLQIQGIQCISLGHQINNNEITSHQYLSTNKVIEDLQANRKAFNKGLVQIRQVIRDDEIKIIKKFVIY